MLSLLNQPYPSNDSPARQLRLAAIIGLFIGVFLLVFQPFGMGLWETPNKPLKLLGFGLITFIITAFNFIVWSRIFPRQFSDERWTVGREILLVTTNILLIAIVNRLYLEWLVKADGYSNVISWVGMILVTFLIGLFPTTGAVLFHYIRQLKKYSQSAAELHPNTPTGPGQMSTPEQGLSALAEPVSTSITLLAENEKDTLTLPPANLLYVESSDNYCTIVYQDAGKIAKPLLRTSLSRLENQIGQPRIVRCHRSFIVNLDQVERVTGNAQGYKLHLQSGQFQIPVARQYNETLVVGLKAV